MAYDKPDKPGKEPDTIGGYCGNCCNGPYTFWNWVGSVLCPVCGHDLLGTLVTREVAVRRSLYPGLKEDMKALLDAGYKPRIEW